MKAIRLLLFSLGLLALHRTGAAQQAPGGADAVAVLDQLATLLPKQIPNAEQVKEAVKEKLNDPATLNELLDSLRAKPAGAAGNLGALAGLLSDLNVRFKAFEPTGTNTNTSLGLEYSYLRSVKNHVVNNSLDSPMSLSFTLHAKGNIAFDSSRNPADFLDTGFSFDAFGSHGGYVPIAASAAMVTRFNRLTDFLANSDDKDFATLRARPEFRQQLESITEILRTQYFWRASGNFSFESNQNFTKKQYTYGLLLSGVINAWNPKSAWADFNVFDWPFAGLRYLTGADPAFQPSGRALPLVVVGLEQVDPSKNTDRLAADPDDSKYGRWHGEIAMKTKVARLGDSTVWAFGSYRVYREISPSAAIRAAGLDNFAYWAVGLQMENGLGVTYSKGKLPLDRKTDQVFDIGYKVNFK